MNLVVQDLSVETIDDEKILNGVSYRIASGEILALVGESGSGKTTAGLAALGHFRTGLVNNSGTVTIDTGTMDTDILALNESARRALRGKTVSYIPQDPALSLNPGIRIGKQIREVLENHGFEADNRVKEVLKEVGLPSDPAYQRRYPHQLSGGQQQRVGIAMAFACRPRVVVLDEPTTGLDVMTQSLVLRTIRQLTKDHGAAALYITHDLAVVAEIADRVSVMYRGSVVESGDTDKVLRTPEHPYTRELVAAVPSLSGESDKKPAGHDALLAVKGVSVSYGDTQVLRGIDLAVRAGECVMLLGESGSGKTTLSHCISGLAHYSGSIALAGTELAPSTKARAAEQLRDLQYVFQSPFSSLNPRKTIAQSVEVPLLRLTDMTRAQRQARVAEMLDRVRLSATAAHRLPDQLSGGQRQRAAIARALVTTPRVLVCDEVTSALDVSVQATILDLLGELRHELGMAMLFVTHNIALARQVADRVAVLHGGEIVEIGDVDQILDDPQHDYTKALLATHLASRSCLEVPVR
ncbi:ABC transporter ATP-binding protein [Kibdelosporangium philippinense]|uniref:ABC transporter ATP-binding protein n=1 Tax=Kibdelosporangium philippinense TaxID=211113 RepID=A0ABS8ZS75_9PSEU|nr:ABC transporter ATP-binding protein [Kibdelosporangium philippinense]MCE7010447.1 ABC transporter ATP-binding protein [Kibdelosporangium philippinense]